MTVSFDSNVDLAVEIGWAEPDPTLNSWVGYSDRVRGFSISRGKSDRLSSFGAGAATVTFDNIDRELDPDNTNATYYGSMILGSQIRISATYSATTYTLFRGYITDIELSYPANGHDAVATFSCLDAAYFLAGAVGVSSYTWTKDGMGGTIQDDAATLAGYPASFTDVETGVATAFTGDQGYSTGGLYALAQSHAASEPGWCFVSADGKVTFYERTHYTGVSSTTYTFGNSGTDLKYTDLHKTNLNGQVRNAVQVTAIGGTAQTAEDSTSQSTYGYQSYSISDAWLANDNEALNVAEVLVLRYADQVPIFRMAYKPMAGPAYSQDLWTPALSLDLRDVITLNLDNPSPASDYSKIVAINSIRHTVTVNKEWVVEYDLEPLSTYDTEQHFIVGTSLVGSSDAIA